jgi:hypothetical protein
MIVPRIGLDYVQLWEPNHIRRRKEELVEAHLTELIDADVQREGLEARKRFETPLPYHGDDPNYGRRSFIEQAKKNAEETFEAERKNYVSAREEKDSAMILEIQRKLKYYVLELDQAGNPTKLKITQEAGHYRTPRGVMMPCTLQYIEGHDPLTLEQITALRNRLLELKDFTSYYSDQTKKLYEDALDLATLEVVSK